MLPMLPFPSDRQLTCELTATASLKLKKKRKHIQEESCLELQLLCTGIAQTML